MRTIAFDLGETLTTYEGIPLSWVDHYRPALMRAAEATDLRISEAWLERACAVLALYNTRLNPREREVSSREIFSAVFDGADVAAQAAFERSFFLYFQRTCRAYPEVRPVLEALRRQGMKIGVLTDVPYGMSREFVLADLASAEIGDLVDVLLTSVDTGFRKPRAEAFAGLGRALGVPSGELSFVGNEEKDIAGIRAVGGLGILIDREGRAPHFEQDRSIASLADLLV